MSLHELNRYITSSITHVVPCTCRLDRSTPWVDYINSLLAGAAQVAAAYNPTLSYLPPPCQVTADEIVNVNAPAYLIKLSQLLKETPKRVQVGLCILSNL